RSSAIVKRAQLPVAAATGADLLAADAPGREAACGRLAAGMRRVALEALGCELVESRLHALSLRSRLGGGLLPLLSQPSPPSEAGSAGSSRRHTRAAAPS